MQPASGRSAQGTLRGTTCALAHAPSRLLLTLLLLLVLLSPPLRAQDAAAPVQLDGREQGMELHGHFSLLRDPGARLDVAQLAERAADFVPSRRRNDLSLGYSSDAVWLRLALRAPAEREGDWRIEFGYPPLDLVELFSVGSDGVQRQVAGDTLPLGQRSLMHHAPLFAVSLAPGEQRTLYFRVRSAGSLTLDARLWSAASFAEHSQLAAMLEALYFGVLLALASYNLLLFITLRDSSFLIFVVFAISFAASMLGFSGFGAQYLWPQGGQWGNRVLPFCLAMTHASAALLSRSFLDTARYTRAWDRLLGVAVAVQLVVTLATLLLPLTPMLQLLALSGVANLLLLLACAIDCLRRRLPTAPLYATACLLLLSGALLLALRNYGVLPSNALTVNALQIASMLAMLLLSFGLAARLNEMKRLKVAAQAMALAAQRNSLQALQEQERLLEQRVAERTEALAAANEHLRELALKDPLTGLANRTALRQHLEQAWQRARRRRELLAVILLDLDGFKPVNDSYGHEAGDLLLVQVARRLQASARATDLVARLGGDEFVLICESIGSPAQAEALAARILDILGQTYSMLGKEIHIGASIGISFGPNGGSGEDLLREADLAMYQAKAAGRNCIRLGRQPQGEAQEAPER
ncbi:diguanylate cyclase [Pseudomonas oryzae]|uniref:Diguanylate cyclase (GGDEF) domain-containing protein n=1 Tax=Pseudomonas oryzae TaxID=1392877 RepID=A0A1H1WB46_9PSED|nr:diguanylate cyclase [Pseudomonas oryzae]SDS93901.1 diguanylate cyclase (GGDEF) domain-containing protein [Pseudomonas oryzae]